MSERTHTSSTQPAVDATCPGNLRPAHTSGFAPARAALRHPAFWAALVVLVVNDHVLKGSGIVPGWLTGKLSDFSWLVVAPVGLSAVLNLRSRAGLGLALGSVSALFAATELSQPLADSVASLATALGQPTRLWADPTDLIALSTLPVTWHLLARPAGADRQPQATFARLSMRMGLGVSIFASVATSPPPPANPTSWVTSAYVANTTTASVAVRLRFAEADLDCSLLRTVDLRAAVARDLFDTGITFRLAPNETVSIEPQAAMFAATGGPPGSMPMTANACDLVLLSTDGAPDTIVLVSGVRGTAPTTLGSGAADTVGPGRRVDLVMDAAGAPEFRVGTELGSALLDDRTPPSDCALSRPTFAHNLGTHGGPHTLLTRSVGPDGCISTTMSDARDGVWSFFFCVPESFFPFLPGDTLTIATTLTGTPVTGPAGTLSFFDRETTSLTAAPFTIEAAAHEACSGERLACGAYVLPREVVVTATGGTTGTPDTELSAPSRTGGTARLRVGVVESNVIAPATCDVGHSTVGTRINAILFVD